MKTDLEKIIDIKIRIRELELNDSARDEIVRNGSYALAEGYETPNMIRINELEEELELLLKNYK